jgi:hypothetical protein
MVTGVTTHLSDWGVLLPSTGGGSQSHGSNNSTLTIAIIVVVVVVIVVASAVIGIKLFISKRDKKRLMRQMAGKNDLPMISGVSMSSLDSIPDTHTSGSPLTGSQK